MQVFTAWSRVTGEPVLVDENTFNEEWYSRTPPEARLENGPTIELGEPESEQSGDPAQNDETHDEGD